MGLLWSYRKMSDQPTWYVMQGEQQLGPYTGQQLAEYAAQGSITRESMVWAEGMPDWIQAAQVENLFPAAQPATTPATGSPYQTPATTDPTAAPGSTPYPHPGVKASSFGMWAGFLVVGIILMIAGFIIAANAGNSSPGPDPDSDDAALGIVLLGLMGIGYSLILVSTILVYVYLYRAWKCLLPGGLARSTPGKAIGFLFIPFFNLYWLFQAFYGLAQDWNRTVDAYPDLRSVPKLSEGVFLTFCICAIVFYPINLFLIFIVMSQITTGINSFAFRPKPHQPGTPGFTLG